MGRVNGSDAGGKAKKVWLCAGCGLWHETDKPKQCIDCGRMDFLFFHSAGEAKHWARLRFLEREGLISGLTRQVPLPLMTVGKDGLACVWGELVVDFAYVEKGAQKYVDYKPAAGMTPDAALKIRCLEAQGTIVEIVTSRGAI